MRAQQRLPHIPSVISLEAILSIDDLYGLDHLLNIAAPDPAEEPDAVISTEVFALCKPGNERVCVVLRADGLTYKSISDITGLTEGQIKNIIYTIRKRVVEKMPTKEVLERLRLQQEANGQLNSSEDC